MPSRRSGHTHMHAVLCTCLLVELVPCQLFATPGKEFWLLHVCSSLPWKSNCTCTLVNRLHGHVKINKNTCGKSWASWNSGRTNNACKANPLSANDGRIDYFPGTKTARRTLCPRVGALIPQRRRASSTAVPIYAQTLNPLLGAGR